ncbi:hypothetical protein AOC36_03970 [Erysipelothrix larvae]|uniref:Metallo-beta-lactamase domain-containing protein n=1 Tax=Erysipelothrix larvae TaxID=1514105 RepID=A0A0X8GZ97_9FIRM|nr:MBL fold metallo-hydrolase [Erysipelothrix larvae]AMC93156.1 hypothetical protein AOC36_03970 [Erysipelothrix larvae]
MLRVEFLGHSGFVVETDKAVYVFDFVYGNLPSHYLKNESKPVLFLVSHHHEDHYSTSVFAYQMTTILSFDIDVVPYRDVFKVRPGDNINLGFAKIFVYPSTDDGVSYVIQEDNLTFMHSGDLNDWHWKTDSGVNEAKEATRSFREIVDRLVQYKGMDLMMFPVDPRLGRDFDQGARYIIEKLEPKIFIPMHYRGQIERLTPFIEWTQTVPSVHFEIPRHDNKYFNFEI